MHEGEAVGTIQVSRQNGRNFRNPAMFGSLAEAYMKSGNLKEAEEYFQKALARDATDQNGKDMLAKIKESKGK